MRERSALRRHGHTDPSEPEGGGGERRVEEAVALKQDFESLKRQIAGLTTERAAQQGLFGSARRE
jgi:hypothetical protein